MTDPYTECIFCGGTPVTEEDVIPKWLWRSLPQSMIWRYEADVPGPNGRLIKQKAKNRNVPFLKVRAVCGDRIPGQAEGCNSTWMSALQREAGPWIDEMRQGHDVDLTPTVQGKLAAWAAMTSTMTLAKLGDPPRADAREDLMRYGDPPRASYVGLSRHPPTQDAHIFLDPTALLPITNPQTRQGGYVVLLMIGQFIVVCALPSWAHPGIDLAWPLDSNRQVPIWPIREIVTRHWPPKIAITEVGMMRMRKAFLDYAIML